VQVHPTLLLFGLVTEIRTGFQPVGIHFIGGFAAQQKKGGGLESPPPQELSLFG
jgi:hypothetical protein